jgi:hypothetical protein
MARVATLLWHYTMVLVLLHMAEIDARMWRNHS